jgi:hypothetical protein
MTPIRANIVGPPGVATRIRLSVAASVTNSAARFCLLEFEDRSADIAGVWKSLVKKVEKRRIRRNQLSHFQVLYSRTGPESDAAPCLV